MITKSISILAAVCLLLLNGCKDFGAGGTGEWKVRARLEQIESQPMESLSVETPTSLPAEPTTRPSTRPVLKEIQLTLEEVRRMSLANNLDLQVELFNPTLSQERLKQEQSRFETLFRTDASFNTTDQPTSSRLQGATGNALSVTPQFQIPLLSGGTIALGANLARSENNNEFSTLNPSFSTDPFVSISQPLLRNGWTDASASGIRVAYYQLQQQKARTKLEVIRVLANADRAYWRVYASREARRVRQQEYDLAVAQLERARRQVRAGVAADVEITRAESGVADQVEAIILAEKDVRDRERELKRILNEPGLEMDSRTALVPASDARPLSYKVDSAELVRSAEANRMELLETELAILEQSANVADARNATLPLVNLQYTYGINGLGGTFNDAFDVARDGRYTDHRLGLQVEIPIGNAAARSALRASLANRMQRLATKQLRLLQIKQEVLGAVDTLDANWQRIVAARQRVVLAARTLDVEIRQFEQGLRTSTDVLDAQTKLASAKLSEVNAVSDYQIAQVDIAFATGTLIGSARVEVESIPVR